MTKLQDNHKRVISSTFHMLEKSIDDMIFILSNNIKECTYEIHRDISESRRLELLLKLNNLKKFIADFVKDNLLEKEITIQSHIFNSKISFWEIHLEEISSKTINKKYGNMGIDTKEYDDVLNFLINYIKSI
jgi:hypothetical protein